MSRRIFVFAMAASATLIASQAQADRECFENSCRLPGVVDLPTPVTAPEAESNPPAAAPSAVEAVEPMAQRQPAPVAETKVETKPKRVVRQAARPAPSSVEPKLEPSAPVHRVDAARDVQAAEPARPVRETRSLRHPADESDVNSRPERRHHSYRGGNGGAVILNVPAAAYANEGITAVRPYVLYTENHAPRLYVLAPNAKIIRVDDND
jgi:hypothetical protein